MNAASDVQFQPYRDLPEPYSAGDDPRPSVSYGRPDFLISLPQSRPAQTEMDNEFTLRKAFFADVVALRELIEASVRGLQAKDYTSAQIEGALASVYGVD